MTLAQFFKDNERPFKTNNKNIYIYCDSEIVLVNLLNGNKLINKPDNKTIGEELDLDVYPFVIRDVNGREIYHELGNDYWASFIYDENGVTKYSDSNTEKLNLLLSKKIFTFK